MIKMKERLIEGGGGGKRTNERERGRWKITNHRNRYLKEKGQRRVENDGEKD